MGTGKTARVRRVACQWKFKREQHDNKAINAMIERAELCVHRKRTWRLLLASVMHGLLRPQNAWIVRAARAPKPTRTG